MKFCLGIEIFVSHARLKRRSAKRAERIYEYAIFGIISAIISSLQHRRRPATGDSDVGSIISSPAIKAIFKLCRALVAAFSLSISCSSD